MARSGVDMQPREFLGDVDGAAAAWPHAMHAQEGEEDIRCFCRDRNDCRFARPDARKRTAWHRRSGPLL